MSSIGEAALLAQRLSGAAKEECTRSGRPEVDVDDLLLALVLSGGPAGRLLRTAGVTVEAARAAVEQVHAERASRLGVAVPSLPPGPIADPARGTVDWSERARKVLGAVSPRSDETAVLLALLDEPSGLVRDVLAALGLPEDEVRRGVAAAPGRPDPDLAGADAEWEGVGVEAFAPAPVEQVWALVTDPARRPVWDSAHESVVARPDGVLEAQAARVRPNGSRARVHRDYRRTLIRVVGEEPGRLVEWELAWPDRAGSRRQRVAVRLEPVPGGTRLLLTRRWQRRRGPVALVRGLVAPLYRFSVRAELQASAAAISRALR